MAFIELDTDDLRSATKMAEQTMQLMSEIQQILSNVTEHNDWICPQRNQINDYIRDNSDKIRSLSTKSDSFYKEIENASQSFDDAQQDVIKRMNELDDLLSSIMTVVPGMNGVGGNIGMVSFEGLGSLK